MNHIAVAAPSRQRTGLAILMGQGHRDLVLQAPPLDRFGGVAGAYGLRSCSPRGSCVKRRRVLIRLTAPPATPRTCLHLVEEVLKPAICARFAPPNRHWPPTIATIWLPTVAPLVAPVFGGPSDTTVCLPRNDIRAERLGMKVARFGISWACGFLCPLATTISISGQCLATWCARANPSIKPGICRSVKSSTIVLPWFSIIVLASFLFDASSVVKPASARMSLACSSTKRSSSTTTA